MSTGPVAMHWPTMHPRAQDSYVAVHVLGYAYRARFRGDTGGYFSHGDGADYESIIAEDLPNYTTDLAAACAVLSWMAERGSSLDLNWGEDTGNWECSWITGGDRYTGISISPAMAICTAALRGVGKDT